MPVLVGLVFGVLEHSEHSTRRMVVVRGRLLGGPVTCRRTDRLRLFDLRDRTGDDRVEVEAREGGAVGRGLLGRRRRGDRGSARMRLGRRVARRGCSRRSAAARDARAPHALRLAGRAGLPPGHRRSLVSPGSRPVAGACLGAGGRFTAGKTAAPAACSGRSGGFSDKLVSNARFDGVTRRTAGGAFRIEGVLQNYRGRDLIHHRTRLLAVPARRSQRVRRRHGREAFVDQPHRNSDLRGQRLGETDRRPPWRRCARPRAPAAARR